MAIVRAMARKVGDDYFVPGVGVDCHPAFDVVCDPDENPDVVRIEMSGDACLEHVDNGFTRHPLQKQRERRRW